MFHNILYYIIEQFLLYVLFFVGKWLVLFKPRRVDILQWRSIHLDKKEEDKRLSQKDHVEDKKKKKKYLFDRVLEKRYVIYNLTLYYYSTILNLCWSKFNALIALHLSVWYYLSFIRFNTATHETYVADILNYHHYIVFPDEQEWAWNYPAYLHIKIPRSVGILIFTDKSKLLCSWV